MYSILVFGVKPPSIKSGTLLNALHICKRFGTFTNTGMHNSNAH